MPELAMPRLSDSMEEGTIIRWLKADGDEVRRGEEIVEIETDKATMAYEADADGILRIVASEGEVVAVGAPIAEIGDGAEPGASAGGGGGGAGAPAIGGGSGAAASSAPAAVTASPASSANGIGEGQASPASAASPGAAASAASSSPASSASGDGQAAPASAASPGANGSGTLSASPLARRVAARLGVDLASVAGTGVRGRILKADVVAASEAPAPPPGPEPVVAAASSTSEELSRVQQTIARRMAESRATVPDFALQVDVDMSEAIALRARLKELADPAPSLNDLIVKACALNLRRHPRANGSYRDGRFELHAEVNVGVAVAAPDSLVVPVIRNADTKSLGAIAAEARERAEKVRANTITPPELSGGTFTVSNLGMFGIDRFEGIVNAPQAAILCVGAIAERPVGRDGEIVLAPMMTITLACDHRILYGADAAAFLGDVRRTLEQPISMVL